MPRVKNPDLRIVNMRLRRQDIHTARVVARARVIPYQHVIRGWVSEMAKRERERGKSK